MGKYKLGKINEAMEFKEWKEKMDKAKVFHEWHKGLLAFLYWTGVRVSEATERTSRDFEIVNGMLIINAPPKKGGERVPLELPLDLPYVDFIVSAVKKANRRHKNKKVFPCTTRHVERIVKAIFGEKYYPHFFRLNRATNFLNDPTTTIPQMKAWFGWRSVETINMYIGYSKRAVKQQAQRLYQDLD